MKKEEFLLKFADVLQTDEDLTFDTNLEDLEYWDSLSIMGTIAFLDKEFGVKTVFNDIKKLKTIKDIAILAGI